MTTLKDVQNRLNDKGFYVDVDGKLGPQTLGALMSALGRLPDVPKLETQDGAVVPLAWMPKANMKRVIVHWTAGTDKANRVDKDHYHILIEGDGSLVRGKPTIDMNAAPMKKGYAAHTLNCNSGSIGVSLCGMAGAQEKPFSPGPCPITKAQWDKLPFVLSDLCRAYRIAVSPTTVLSHAEVQANLGIAQRQKWDIAILPFDRTVNTAKEVGDDFRRKTIGLI